MWDECQPLSVCQEYHHGLPVLFDVAACIPYRRNPVGNVTVHPVLSDCPSFWLLLPVDKRRSFPVQEAAVPCMRLRGLRLRISGRYLWHRACILSCPFHIHLYM